MSEPAFDETAFARDYVPESTPETAPETPPMAVDDFLGAPITVEDFYNMSGAMADELAPTIQEAIAEQLGSLTEQHEPEYEPTLDEYLGDPFSENFSENLAGLIDASNATTLEQVQQLVAPLVQAANHTAAREGEQLISDTLDAVDVGAEFDKTLARELFESYKPAAVAQFGVTQQALEFAAEQAVLRAAEVGTGGTGGTADDELAHEADRLVAGAIDSVSNVGDFDRARARELFASTKAEAVELFGVTEEALAYAAEKAARGAGGGPSSDAPYDRRELRDELSVAAGWQAPPRNTDRRPAANPGARRRAFEAVKASRGGR